MDTRLSRFHTHVVVFMLYEMLAYRVSMLV